MKLKNIEIRNFRSCDGQYPLEQINCIYGHNGVGKSSFLDALWYLLTGKLGDNVIKWGSDCVDVSAVIDDGQNTEISRTHYLPDTYRIDDEDVKIQAFQREVEKKFSMASGTSLPVVDASASNPFFVYHPEAAYEFFMTGKVENARMKGVKELFVTAVDGTEFYMRKSMPSKVMVDGRKVTSKALAELIEDRMGGSVKGLELVTSSKLMNAMKMTDFAKYLISIIPVTVDYDQLEKLAALSPEESAVLRPMFPAPPLPITIADVQNAYKALFETRAAVGREKEIVKNRAVYDGPLPIMDKAVVKGKLDEITKQLGAAEQIRKAHAAYANAMAERQKMIDTLARLEAEFAAMPDGKKADEAQAKYLYDTEMYLRSEVENAVRQVSALQQANVPILKMLEALNTTICPLCDKLVCNTDKTSCRADLEDSVRKNQEVEQQLTEKYNRDRAQLEEILRQREAANQESVLFERKQSMAAQIENLKKSIPASPEMPSPIPDTTALAKLQEKYREYARQCNLYEESLRMAVEHEKKEQEYNLISSCVRKAEPKKGLLTNTILEYILSPFCNHVNEFLQEIHGDIEVSFRMDDDGLSLYCSPHSRGGFARVDDLSTGEKMLVTFALMDMVSNISNSRMLVFDCLENIDEVSLTRLMELLTKTDVRDRYDHIILSFVDHKSIAGLVDRYAGFVNIIKM